MVIIMVDGWIIRWWKCFLRRSNRQESFLNTVARTYMMELSDEILKSIRDEMLPLAEKWWEYDIWKQNRVITAWIDEYNNVSIPEKLYKKGITTDFPGLVSGSRIPRPMGCVRILFHLSRIYIFLSDPTSTSTSCDSQIRRYTNNSWLVAHLDRSEINILLEMNTLKNGQEQEA